jgi:L-malate glycosyltransferase
MTAGSADELRILVFADGASIHTEKWLVGLRAAGPSQLSLVTMNPAGVRASIRNIDGLRAIHELYAGRVNPAGGNWRYLLNVPSVLRAVRHTKPDAIVALYLSSYGLMGAIAKGGAALAHVLMGGDVMIAPGRSRLYRWLARQSLARGDLFVSPSKVASARIPELARIPAGSLLTQQYGLEDRILDYPARPKSYLFVSNRAWLPNSNILQLLRIVAGVPFDGPVALVGAGGALEGDIRRQANADGRVVSLGSLTHEQNVDVVARSSFYVSMTRSDGASVSLMEAMALGAIPIVSDIEPNREWVDDGINGIVLPLDDEDAAAARVEWILDRPADELEAMRERNRVIIRERGSLTRNMARFRERLVETIQRKRGQG